MQRNDHFRNKESLNNPPIRPGSIVKLVKCDNDTPLWKDRLEALFRIGYYSVQDGFDVIWLVDDQGEYCETIDEECLLKYFQVEFVSDETEFYGENRPPFKAL